MISSHRCTTQQHTIAQAAVNYRSTNGSYTEHRLSTSCSTMCLCHKMLQSTYARTVSDTRQTSCNLPHVQGVPVSQQVSVSGIAPLCHMLPLSMAPQQSTCAPAHSQHAAWEFWSSSKIMQSPLEECFSQRRALCAQALVNRESAHLPSFVQKPGLLWLVLPATSARAGCKSSQSRNLFCEQVHGKERDTWPLTGTPFCHRPVHQTRCAGLL